MPRKKKFHTLEAETIVEIIRSGKTDRDIRELRNECNRRLRDLAVSNSVYEIGERVVFTTHDADYLPRYMDGAEGVITDIHRYSTPEDKKARRYGVKATGDVSAYIVMIESMKHKPRGGPDGNPPRYVVGRPCGVRATSIRPVDPKAHLAKVAEIKQQYGLSA